MIISQNQASIQCGVNRSTISRDARKENRHIFFVDTPDGVQIDTSYPEWKEYIDKKQSRGDKVKAREKLKNDEKTPKNDEKVEIIEEKVEKVQENHIEIEKESEIEQKQPKIPAEKPRSAQEIREENEKKLTQEIKDLMHSGNVVDLTPTVSTQLIMKMEKLYKAQKISEEALMKRNQRLEQEKKYAHVDLAKYLFGSFMERMKQEYSILPHKIMPQQKALLLNGEDKKAEKLWLNEFEGIFKRVMKDQQEAVKNWEEEK